MSLDLYTGGMKMAETKEQKLVNRSQRVAFMNTDTTGGTAKFERMTGFTSMTNAKNPKEYSRQYVDEDSERADVVGYAPSIDYSFDRHSNNPVHERIASIHDGEKLGSDTHVDIIVVDLFKKSTTGDKFYTIKRTYAVIPDSDGDGTDMVMERMRLFIAVHLSRYLNLRKVMLRLLERVEKKQHIQKAITTQQNKEESQ